MENDVLGIWHRYRQQECPTSQRCRTRLLRTTRHARRCAEQYQHHRLQQQQRRHGQCASRNQPLYFHCEYRQHCYSTLVLGWEFSTRSSRVANYEVITEFSYLGLHSAAANGNVGLVIYARSHGQPINSVLDGVLPLHAASAGGMNL